MRRGARASRSIATVLRTRSAGLVLAPLALLCLSGATARAAAGAHQRGAALPHAHAAAMRGAAPARAHVAAVRSPAALPKVLRTLAHSGSLQTAELEGDLDEYRASVASLRGLSGTRARELGAVIADAEAEAAAGAITPSRLPATMLTLHENSWWWATQPLPAADAHVSTPGSELVWEYYPGQGIQIQWLATFGDGNGFYLAGQNSKLRTLLAEVLPLAAERAGGIAWEYQFQFDGGKPPWTSALSQGTALQLLARAYTRLQVPEYLQAAERALAVFTVAPPAGVRVATPTGALYAQYTFAPSVHIINGFIQSLVGLWELTSLTKNPLGEQLFEAGDAEARTLLPRYNTGAWSLYDQYEESDLNYHELLTEFLVHLCERTSRGEPLEPTAAIVADELYCTTAQEFEADLRTPPAIALLSEKLAGGVRAGVQISLSKISIVHLTVRRGSTAVREVSAVLSRGDPRLLWVTPSSGGTFTVQVSATDLAGNTATTSGSITVKPAHRRRL